MREIRETAGRGRFSATTELSPNQMGSPFRGAPHLCFTGFASFRVAGLP